MTAIRHGYRGAALLVAINADRLLVAAALAASLALCGGLIEL